MDYRRNADAPVEWLSAEVFSEVPLTSVTSPFELTTVVSSLNATDFLCVDIMLDNV